MFWDQVYLLPADAFLTEWPKELRLGEGGERRHRANASRNTGLLAGRAAERTLSAPGCACSHRRPGVPPGTEQVLGVREVLRPGQLWANGYKLVTLTLPNSF